VGFWKTAKESGKKMGKKRKEKAKRERPGQVGKSR
jgi:hypothetical protein